MAVIVGIWRAMARLYLALDLTLLHTPADTESVMLACMGCSVGNVVGWRMVFGVIVRHVCCLLYLYPNKSGIVPEPHGTGANEVASKSFLCAAGLLCHV